MAGGGAAVRDVSRGDRGGGVTAGGGGGAIGSGFEVGAVGVFGTAGDPTEGAATTGGETNFCSVTWWTGDGFSATGCSGFAEGGDG